MSHSFVSSLRFFDLRSSAPTAAGVLLFAESMEEVGDAYSIAGFASKYRDNVSYYTIKEFDQPYTTNVKSVIGGLSGRLASV